MISSNEKLHILLVEDQVDLCQNIAQFMEQQGHVMDFAHNGSHGLDLALEQLYDLIILDLMLPGMNGLEVCQQLRQKATKHIPIIMLTARDTLNDKVTGFHTGADDYLTKPFALEELYVRCLAITKRNQVDKAATIELGEITLDKQRKQVFRQSKQLELSTMSYRILAILMDAHPQVVTRSELSQKLWGDAPTESDALRSHIYQLRQSLDKPFAHPIIKTIHGVGFALDI